MHHTIFHSTTAGLHFCYPTSFCGCPLAHHLSDCCVVSRVLLQCIQQLLCSQHLSLVIKLGEEPLHLHRDAASLHNSPYFGGSNCSPIATGVAASRPSCRAMSTGIQIISERLLPCFSCASSSQPERPPLLYASSSSHSEQWPNLL